MNHGTLPPDAVFEHGESVSLPATNGDRGIQIGCLRVLSVKDASTAQPGRYLVKHLFYADQFCIVFGEPGCGKSFLMSHIAYAVAQGRSVFDRKVTQAGVLYLSLEGGNGFEQRIRALAMEFGDCDHFHFVAHPVNFFEQSDAVQSVIDVALRHSVGLIVVDTLARAIGAADENASQDMGRLISLMDTIRERTGACVVLIHHTPKNGPATPRGHSSLMGAADLILKVEKSEARDIRQGTVVKAKDGEEGGSISFTLRQVEVGIDSDGDPVTTCIVDWCEASTKPRTDRLTVDERGYLADIQRLFADGSRAQLIRPHPDMPLVRAVTREEVRETFRRAGRFDAAAGPLNNAERQKFGRILNRLKNRGAICMTDKHVWLPDTA